MVQQSKQLNYVYIFCDELRTDVLSCYNHGSIKTPNIDKIAEEGMLFDQCYCNSPVCVPSRFSILSGQYPEKTGVYHNEAAYPSFHLKKEWETFPEIIAKHGYVTASFGKTHIPQTENPVFQFNNEAGGEADLGVKFDELKNVFRPKGSFKSILAADYPENKKYCPEFVTENALEWIDQQIQPFFARISYLQPHTPIIVKKEFVDMLKNYEFPDKITNYQTSQFEEQFKKICDIQDMEQHEVAKIKMYYQALVLWIDNEVGKILTYLEQHNLKDNTVIIFHADHGASRGENGALAKQIFAPQSHRVPLIISCKNKVDIGINHNICEGIDLAPTLLSLSDIPIPEHFQGMNLFKEKKDYVYSTIGFGEANSYAFPNKKQGKYIDDQPWPRRACIRTQKYRLDMNVRQNGQTKFDDIFFCDVEKYPLENVNLVNEHEYTEIINDLYNKLKEHVKNSVEVDDINDLIFQR